MLKEAYSRRKPNGEAMSSFGAFGGKMRNPGGITGNNDSFFLSKIITD